LAVHRKQRKAAVLSRGDGIGCRREKHLLRTSRELAHDLAAAAGEGSPDVEHSRAEIAGLRQLR
jgi:hypothetical protein